MSLTENERRVGGVMGSATVRRPERSTKERGGREGGLPVERLPGQVRMLVAASFVIAIGYGIVTPALPIFARSFDVSISGASALVSAFAAVRLAFAPVSGRLAGRVPALRLFCAGLLVVALSSAACAAATGYLQLLTFRAVGGLGSTMFTVSAALLLIRLTPPALLGRATGAWATGFLLGTVAGPLLAGALSGMGLRAPFLVYAGLLVLVALVGATVLRRCEGAADDDPAGGGTATFLGACGHPTFRAALAANFVHGWITYGVRVALVPLYVVEVLAKPPGWAGLALAVTAAGTLGTLLVGGRWADSRGRAVPVRTGLAITAVGMLCTGLATDIVAFLAASLLAGVGSGLVNPPTNAAVADVVAGEDRIVGGGSALAGFQMVGDVGAIAGPVLAGLVAQLAGYGAAFAVSASIAVVALSCWLHAPDTLARAAPGVIGVADR